MPNSSIHARTVRRLALQLLSPLESFIVGSQGSNELAWYENLASHGRPIGVYINSSTNYIIVADYGLDVQIGDYHCSIKYDDVTQISPPQMGDQDLDVAVESAEINDICRYSIPIFGGTEEAPDIRIFHDFLTKIVPIDLLSVESRKDLMDYLERGSASSEVNRELVNEFLMDFRPDALEALKIDKNLMHNPGFWRAVAFAAKILFRWTPS